MDTYTVNTWVRPEILASIYQLPDIFASGDAHTPGLPARLVDSSESWYMFHASSILARYRSVPEESYPDARHESLG
jgi:hypothetical protein